MLKLRTLNMVLSSLLLFILFSVFILTGTLVYCEVKSESEVAQSCLTLCDPMDTRLLHPWDFLGKITGVGCHLN